MRVAILVVGVAFSLRLIAPPLPSWQVSRSVRSSSTAFESRGAAAPAASGLGVNNKGHVVWKTVLGGNGTESAAGVAALPVRGVAVVGSSASDKLLSEVSQGGTRDILAARILADGTVSWARLSGGAGADFGQAITTGARAVYTVGFTDDGKSGDIEDVDPAEGLVSKWSLAGERLWTRYIGAGPAFGIAAAGTRSILVTGAANRPFAGRVPMGGQDAFVAKLSTAGELIWYTLIGTTRKEGAHAVAADRKTGSIVVTGHDGLRPFVARLNRRGKLEWRRTLSARWAEAADVAVGNNGAIYLVGSAFERIDITEPQFVDVVVARLNPHDGRVVWTRRLRLIGQDAATGVAVGTDDAVYVAGASRPSSDQIRPEEPQVRLLMKFSPLGSRHWLRTEAMKWNGQFFADVAAAQDGTVYLLGADGQANNPIRRDLVVTAYR